MASADIGARRTGTLPRPADPTSPAQFSRRLDADAARSMGHSTSLEARAGILAAMAALAAIEYGSRRTWYTRLVANRLGAPVTSGEVAAYLREIRFAAEQLRTGGTPLSREWDCAMRALALSLLSAVIARFAAVLAVLALTVMVVTDTPTGPAEPRAGVPPGFSRAPRIRRRALVARATAKEAGHAGAAVRIIGSAVGAAVAVA